MSDTIQHQLIGTILPLGNGAVGKTTLGTLLAFTSSDITGIKKTKNLEFEYSVDRIHLDGESYKVSHQYLIPPGQKEEEGDQTSRSYEKVIHIYQDIIGIPSVVLLTYDITHLESFYDLEFWVKQASKLADKHTELILVGTHLDADSDREVHQDLIRNGIIFLEQTMAANLPGWGGCCNYMEVSNHTRTNIDALRRMISMCILRSKGIFMKESQPEPAEVPSQPTID